MLNVNIDIDPKIEQAGNAKGIVSKSEWTIFIQQIIKEQLNSEAKAKSNDSNRLST